MSNSLKWQDVTTLPQTHHALKIAEGVSVRIASISQGLNKPKTYEFLIGDESRVRIQTTKTGNIKPGDWIVKTDEGYEYFSAEEFNRHYLEKR
jgi:hypothetical protein